MRRIWSKNIRHFFPPGTSATSNANDIWMSKIFHIGRSVSSFGQLSKTKFFRNQRYFVGYQQTARSFFFHVHRRWLIFIGLVHGAGKRLWQCNTYILLEVLTLYIQITHTFHRHAMSRKKGHPAIESYGKSKKKIITLNFCCLADLQSFTLYALKTQV